MKRLFVHALYVFTFGGWVTPVLCQYPQLHFPMSMGDRWQYVEAPSFFHDAKVVSDTVLIGSFSYSQFSGLLVDGYYRKDGSRLYRRSGGADRLIADFSAKKGDTLGYYKGSPDTIMILASDQGLWQCFDRLRYQMKFLHVSKHSPGMIRALYQVADSVGFVSVGVEGIILAIVGAQVSGRSFGVITSVASRGGHVDPDQITLQNYPNPFNPTTAISFQLSAVSVVTLKVIDVLGREIATLVNDVRSAGTYTVQWDASAFPSGTYFYRLQAGNASTTSAPGFVETKKMILLR